MLHFVQNKIENGMLKIHQMMYIIFLIEFKLLIINYL